MTPSEVAAAIRQHSPGALPESVTIEDHYGIPAVHAYGVYLRSDIAEAVLIAAMVQDACLARWPGCDWVGNQKTFADADHGGSLGACHAAWRWAKGVA